jgi:hypothetical protein
MIKKAFITIFIATSLAACASNVGISNVGISNVTIPTENLVNERNPRVEQQISKLYFQVSDYGFKSKSDVVLVKNYVRHQMLTNPACYTVLDVAPSSSKKNYFFMHCLKENTQRRFLTTHLFIRKDASELLSVKPKTHVSETTAIESCKGLLISNTTHPYTFKQRSYAGVSRVGQGTTLVRIEFSAKNGLGIKVNYHGNCYVYHDNTTKLLSIKLR